jgi:hypothetical protein
MLSAANNTDCAALVALSITADCGISLVAGGNRHLFVDLVLVNIPTSEDIDQNCAFGKHMPSCNSSMMVTPLVPNPTTRIFSPRLLLEDDDDFFFSAEEEAECARTLTLSEENRRRRCLHPSPPTPLPMVVLFLLNFALSRWCRWVEKRHPLSSSSFRRNAALLAENEEEEEEEVTKSRWEEALATPFPPPVLLMLPRTKNIFFSY